MRAMTRGFMVFTSGAVMLWAGLAAGAPTDAQKCEAYKLKHAGKYNLCRLKAEAKAVKTGNPADYSRCDTKLGIKFTRAETKWGSACVTTGDAAYMQNWITADTDDVATCLSGSCAAAPTCQLPATGQTTSYGTGDDGDVQAGATLSYTDNGDGTITDNNTGLMWEKKDDNNAGSVHDQDNTYTWTAGTTAYDGTVVTVFLDTLNNYCDDDEATACTTDAQCSGAPNTYASNDLCGHAGHRDWRLPNVKELQSIVNYGNYNPAVSSAFNTSCAAGCYAASCSCTASSSYWCSTTYASDPGSAWFVYFGDGFVDYSGNKFFHGDARAVRGGL